MSEAMRREILSQPAALRSLLARADEITASMARIAGDAKRIWAVGHGDSYFAPLAAADAFRRWTTVPYAPLLAHVEGRTAAPENRAWSDLLGFARSAGGAGLRPAGASAAVASARAEEGGPRGKHGFPRALKPRG